ncbi:hypothetical protein HS125_17170 [bacterium]|nr:hypothetical protein [bacterium]
MRAPAESAVIRSAVTVTALTGKQSGNYNFSNEVIPNEAVTLTLNTAGTSASGALAVHSGGGIRPGTVSIAVTFDLSTASSSVAGTLQDNGQGGQTARRTDTGAALTVAASAINCMTGAFSITITGDAFASASATATYRVNLEGSSDIPEVDVQITTSTVETERRAIKLRYSREAADDVMAEWGFSLEPTIIQGIAAQCIAEMWVYATVASTFSITPGSGVAYNQQAHFADFIYNLNVASNAIQFATRIAYGNWIIVDQGAANVIESLPGTMFQAAPRPEYAMGLHYIGLLMGKFRVYKWLYLSALPGVSAYGNLLMGWKGTEPWDAGFVLAPQHQLYTTDQITLEGFVSRRGFATRNATKVINPNVFRRINLSA